MLILVIKKLIGVEDLKFAEKKLKVLAICDIRTSDDQQSGTIASNNTSEKLGNNQEVSNIIFLDNSPFTLLHRESYLIVHRVFHSWRFTSLQRDNPYK